MSKAYTFPVEDVGVRPVPDLVRAELNRLLQSDQFKNSKRCRTLLSYIVEETIAGRDDQLKERIVGVNVFGRNLSYETSEYPVVRNAAIEVRRRLAQFYVESETELRCASIPVPPGHYSLTLYFAEAYFHAPGKRVFDVSCNGVMLMHRLDIFQQAGFAHVYQKTFRGLEPNGQGKLFISFSPIVNYASVRALEVVDESR